MKKNKTGFTLIELLAVIVILGVLLAIAVPSVTKLISESKKSTYIDNAQSYASVALQQTEVGTFRGPVNPKEAVVISFKALAEHLERGGKTSSYGSDYDLDHCFVAIVNTRTSENPKYASYIAAIDQSGYGIGSIVNGVPTAQIINYNNLTNDNIIHATTGVSKPEVGQSIVTADGTFTVAQIYSE